MASSRQIDPQKLRAIVIASFKEFREGGADSLLTILRRHPEFSDFEDRQMSNGAAEVLKSGTGRYRDLSIDGLEQMMQNEISRLEPPKNTIGLLALGFALLERALDIVGYHNLIAGATLFIAAFVCFCVWFIKTERAQRWRPSLRVLIISLAALAYFSFFGFQLYKQFKSERAASSSTIETQHTLQTKRILLTPGNHPTPPGPACTGDGLTPLTVPNGAIAVFFGDSIAIASPTEMQTDNTVVLNIDGEDLLSFTRATGEISLTALFRDQAGQEIAHINNNLVNVNFGEILNPDAHNLAILTSDGNRLFSIRYVNESAIVVSGTFRGKNGNWIDVKDRVPFLLPNRMLFSQNCYRDLPPGRALFRF